MLLLPGLIHLVEDIAPQSGVLGLFVESCMIDLNVLWVNHTLTSSSCHIFELLTVKQFSGAWFALALTIDSGVVDARGGAVCKADFVFLGNLAVDFLHRECIFNVCHFVFGNRVCGYIAAQSSG